MNRQFEMWLRSGETNLLSLKLERESYIFLRLPKRPGFDYLFAQRQYRGDGALIRSPNAQRETFSNGSSRMCARWSSGAWQATGAIWPSAN